MAKTKATRLAALGARTPRVTARGKFTTTGGGQARLRRRRR
jgi:hypothetical protein